MKKLKIYILSLLMVGVSFSCEETLDINTDPLAATSADPNAVLPFVLVQYTARKTTELGTRITDVTAHMSQNFNSPKLGNTTSFLTGNTWGMYYTDVLGNIQLVENDAKELGPPSNNVAAIAIIIKSLAFYELTSIWGDIPFSQASNGQEFPTPAFDDQETVLRGVVTLLDEAIALIDGMPDSGVFDVSTGDIIYGGDMSLWRRYANSLKLRVLMMIRNQDTSVDSEITATLAQPLIENNAQAAFINYSGAPGQENGFWSLVNAFFGPSNEPLGVHQPSETIYDLLNSDNDPRLNLFLINEDAGAPETGFNFESELAIYSDNVIRPDYPDVWFLPAEISFYRAELALKGVTGDDAQALYEQGITQTLEFWGGDIPGVQLTLSSTEISDYIAGLPTLGSLSTDEALAAVHNQQYLETFLRPIVGWNHIRRTDVPAVPTPPGSDITTYLKRFTYPPDEIASNPNAPINPNTDVPQWFEN